MIDALKFTFEDHGAALFPGAALPVLADLEAALAGLPADRAGLRLHGIPALTRLLGAGERIGAIAASRLGAGCRPVRAILFDKTPATNWALGWHQDRTIAVRERRDTPGFGPWTLKHGMSHVEPPFDLIAEMLTMRVHFDDVPESNAPLLIAPASHRLGKIPEAQIAATVDRLGTAACEAKRGDIWLYSTPILHASDAAMAVRHRRVLQIDFSDRMLPGDLEWLGV